MFTRIHNKFESMVRLNVHAMIQSVFQQGNIRDEIIRLNTEDQLFAKGENSLSVRLDSIGGPYSQLTIAIKKEKGQPVDRITLKDTGDFYNSFEVIANTGDDFITIKADPMKPGMVNILDDWGVEVIGLNEENTQWLRNEIREQVISKIKAVYLAA